MEHGAGKHGRRDDRWGRRAGGMQEEQQGCSAATFLILCRPPIQPVPPHPHLTWTTQAVSSGSLHHSSYTYITQSHPHSLSLLRILTDSPVNTLWRFYFLSFFLLGRRAMSTNTLICLRTHQTIEQVFLTKIIKSRQAYRKIRVTVYVFYNRNIKKQQLNISFETEDRTSW